MNRYVPVLVFLATAAPTVCTGAVYKCLGEGGQMVYQDAPCAEGELQVPLAASSPGTQARGGAQPVSGPGSGMTQARALAIGASDTEVLNMRGWGRPQKITRTRGRDGWREEWTYLSRPEEKRILQFVNGTLTAASSEPVLPEPQPRLLAITGEITEE